MVLNFRVLTAIKLPSVTFMVMLSSFVLKNGGALLFDECNYERVSLN